MNTDLDVHILYMTEISYIIDGVWFEMITPDYNKCNVSTEHYQRAVFDLT